MRKYVALALVVAVIFAAVAIGFAGCDRARVDFVKTDGENLLDGSGKPFGLTGTNLGGWLVQESWLSPTDIGREYGQIDMLIELANRFGKEDAEKLIAAYEDNWVTEKDFEFVKSLGMNCVRLPFTYMNIYDAVQYDETAGEYKRTPFEDLALRDDAFDRIDWAVEMCKKYGLYIILDLHGAVGSQNGNDHSGDISVPSGGQLWRDDEIGEICRQKTKDLWVEVAARYKDERCVAFFDLLNEPGIKDANGTQTTDKVVWDYFDELYKAIRSVDKNHAVCMESCWEAANLPDPAQYGWENVIYQYHHYNWASEGSMSNSMFYNLKLATLAIADRGVPTFVGEFNVWGDDARFGEGSQTDEQAWKGVIELYCGMGWNFTTWNFKHAATNSSWGLLNLKEDHRQANFLTDEYEQIKQAWEEGNSANYRENEWLTACIKPYLSQFNATHADVSDREFDILL